MSVPATLSATLPLAVANRNGGWGNLAPFFMSGLSFHDETDSTITVATEYDLSRVHKTIDYCKERSNSGNVTALGGDKLVATVDPGVIHLWCANKGVTFSEFMRDQKLAKQFLEDSDNSQFRIWKGAI